MDLGGMDAADSTKYVVCGRIPGDDDDTVAEVSIRFGESPVEVFIEKVLYDGNIPADWKSRQPNRSENRYCEWAYIQSVSESSQDQSDENWFSKDIAEFACLPPHDPARYETVDDLDNPSCTNGMRAAFARVALEKFQQTCKMNEDIDVATSDLICDLFHLVHSSGHQPLSILKIAFEHFLAEARGESGRANFFL